MKSLCLFLILSALSPLAAAKSTPEALHQKHCLRCHTPTLYTRPDRAIESKAALKRQVRLCQGRENLRWSDETIRDVADYLDRTYYHLKK